MAIIHRKIKTIKEDPNIKAVLERMPDDDVKESFTDVQLENLKIALGARDWKTHPIDIRFTIPFIGKRYYVVFIAGKSLRSGRLQKLVLRKAEIIFVALFITAILLFSLLLLYLVKSSLGIDVFDGFSLGIWSWIKDTLLNLNSG